MKERKWWETMPIEPQQYRTTGRYPTKSKKLHAVTTEIAKLKEETRTRLKPHGYEQKTPRSLS